MSQVVATSTYSRGNRETVDSESGVGVTISGETCDLRRVSPPPCPTPASLHSLPPDELHFDIHDFYAALSPFSVSPLACAQSPPPGGPHFFVTLEKEGVL